MNKITMLIKASEVMAVRRAIFEAGAERVEVNPLHSHEWEASLADWYHGKKLQWQDAPISLDVFAEKNQITAVISAFMRVARVGKIEKISPIKRHDQNFSPAFQAA